MIHSRTVPSGCLMDDYMYVVGESDILEVVFICEAASVEDFVVVRTKLGRVGPLYGVHEVTLAFVLHECV